MLLLDTALNALRMAVKAVLPLPGRIVVAQPTDRYDHDAGRDLTPSGVDRIMTLANSGDIAELSRLALELEEKDWDIQHALDVRRRAVTGICYKIEPGGEAPADKAAAAALQTALDSIDQAGGLDTFSDLSEDLMSALVPGFAVSEIVWGAGGEILGFNFIEQYHFTAIPDPLQPVWSPKALRLITLDRPQGTALPDNKFVVHRYRRRGGDVARGGLIRPLAWLYCFKNSGIKDLERFVERFGMPFVVAKVDQATWDKELTTLQRLIRNFGPGGGGVFTKAVEVALLQTAATGGDIYFKLLEYYGAAIIRLILGQTATSSSGGGLSGDNAQAAVRQDILEADCKLLDATQTAMIARPFTTFNFAPNTKTPKIVRQCQPPEDTVTLATTVKTLNDAGLEADADEMTERFGIKLTRKVAAAPVPFGGNSATAEPGAPDPNRHVAEADSAALGAEPGNDTAATDNLVKNAVSDAIKTGAAAVWLGPLAVQLAKIADSDSADLTALSDLSLDSFGSSDGIAKTVSETAYAAAAIGAANQATTVAPKRGGAI